MPSPGSIERIKLLANWCNNLSTALVTVGVFTPASVVIYGIGDPPKNAVFLAILPLVCILAALALHLSAQWFLNALDEPDDEH
jgi:hypothetical protein